MNHKITPLVIWTLIRKTVSEWQEDKAAKMAAALAYFTAVSIAPLLVVAVLLFVFAYGQERAAQMISEQVARLTDPHVADALKEPIAHALHSGAGVFATLVSVVIAIAGASGVFAELQDSLNTIWEVRPKPNRSWIDILRDRFRSVTMVFGIAFLLLVSMVVSTILSAVSSEMVRYTVGTDGTSAKIIAIVIEVVFSTAVVTTLFAAMFKVLPDVNISWGDVWLGGFVTAVLFQVGKYGLSIYLSKASPGSPYGALGSLVAMLVWVYYSAQILFLGAEFTQVYANEFGTHIVPSANAEPLTEEMRAQAGIPHEHEISEPHRRRRVVKSEPPHRIAALNATGETAGRVFIENVVPAAAIAILFRAAMLRTVVAIRDSSVSRRNLAAGVAGG